MSGRSLLAASVLLPLALGTAAPGAAQVIEEPHWRGTVTQETELPHQRPAQLGVRGDVPKAAAMTARAGG